MKTYLKQLLLMVFTAVLVTSCIDGDLNEPDTARGNRYLNSLDVQAASIEATLSDVRSLQEALDGENPVLTSAVESLEEHTAFLKNCSDWAEGSLATLQHQKTLASAIGTVAAHNESLTVEAVLEDIEDGAVSWLGKNYKSYYPAVVAYARTAILVEDCSKTLKSQKVHIEGIASDIEAGLKEGVPEEEVAEVAASVDEAITSAGELLAFYEGLVSEIETAYQQAVATAVEDPESFDSDELASLNKTASVDLKSGDLTLSDLVARVEAFDTRLTDIEGRVTTLEGKVDDLNGLLNMIQSVTFMSDYSAENAIAYYTLGSESRADGKKVRNPEGTIDLRYVIRPASAAQALTVSDLWDDEVKVFGYYAKAITKAAPETFFDFDITNVTADESGNGIVTVTVSVEESLDESFYFKETGAKLALSIATGKTDLTSKFVEIVPKDKSGTVYVEGIELSAKSIEIDHGTKADLDAYITPDNVTEGGVIWTTSNANVVNVTENGVIEGMSVGNATITATTKGTNEWGNTILAQCNVKVNPAIKLSGPSYVEEKGNITIRIESPDYIDPESVTWTSSAPTLAAITKTDDGNALISGEAMYFSTTDKAYTPITITCDIEDKATLSHEIRVIAVQPKGVAIEGLSSGQNALTLKKGQEYTFNSTVQPAEVDMTLFRFRYQSNNTEVVNVPDIEIGKVVANTIGSATVSVKVTDQGQYNYFYPARNEYVRYVDVTVEPYWVTGITLPTTWEMKPGDEGSISATFTSDGGENVQPTDMTLSWTSDNSSVVEVDAVTGKMTAKETGTAVITATSTSVPSGSPSVIATCVVTVKEASAADPKVGDYYYSDGTWSTERDTEKTVIGIVFSTQNATGDDSKLREDYPACSNGLVISVKEMSSIFGGSYGLADQNNGNEMYDWVKDNYASANYTTTVANGYTATLSLKGYQQYRNAADCCQIVSVLNDSNLPAAPTAKPNSGWYIPSYKEMQLLNAERTVVNSAISNVGGNQIGEGDYWTSSLDYYESRSGSEWFGYTYFYDTYCYPFNMTNNGWTASNNYSTAYPVRVVLAF